MKHIRSIWDRLLFKYSRSDETPWWLFRIQFPPAKQLVWVTVAYIFLTVLWTYPMISSFQTAILATPANANNPDTLQAVWVNWYLFNRWFSHFPILSTDIFYPLQINMTYQSFGFSQFLIALPITTLFGPIAGANIVISFSFIVAAVAMFIIVWSYSKRTFLSFVGGWIFVITPAHMANIELSSFRNSGIHWLAILQLFLLIWVYKPTIFRSVGIGVFLIFVSFVSGYFGLFSGLYTSLFAVFAIQQTRSMHFLKQLLPHLFIIFALWGGSMYALLAIPGATYTPLTDQTHLKQSELYVHDRAELRDWQRRQSLYISSFSLTDFVTPQKSHPLRQLFGTGQEFPYQSPLNGYIGIPILILIIYTWWRWKTPRPLILFVVFLLSLSMGISMRIWYTQSFPGLPGTFWLLDAFSFFRNATRPALLILWAWIPLTFVIVYGLYHSPRGFTFLFFICCLIDFWPPKWQMVPVQADSSATILAQHQNAGAILTLPYNRNDDRPLVNQMCHGHPIAGGYLSRTPNFPTPMYGSIQQLPEQKDIFDYQPAQELANMGIRTVVLNQHEQQDTYNSLLNSGARLMGTYGSQHILSMPIPAHATLSPRYGWREPESDSQRTWRWAQSTSSVSLIADRDQIVTLRFAVSHFSQDQNVRWYVNGKDMGILEVPKLGSTLTKQVVFLTNAGMNTIEFISQPPVALTEDDIALTFTEFHITDVSEVFNARTITTPPQMPLRVGCP